MIPRSSLLLGTLLCLGAAAGLAPAAAALGDGTVAVQAGTIHLVAGDQVIENGTIVVVDGRITAVGADVAIPHGARVVDYGADAVIVPGFVAADSTFGSSIAAPRTAEPDLRAVDGFDPYTNLYTAVTSGVTSTYLAPARGRLVAGQGAVVKSAGEKDSRRVLSDSVGLHGSIGAEARRTPGYWEPPVPATVDQGMGVARKQLPRTTMGAMVALEELLALARGEGDAEEYGPYAGPGLARHISSKKPWRMGADSAEEIRALLEFFGSHGLPLVIDGAAEAGQLATEIAAAGVPVIVDVSMLPNQGGRDFGKGEGANWPNYGTAAALHKAGAKVAISTPATASASELRFAAGLAMRGGLSAAEALRAITLSPAEILGVADRVGSIADGKDADFVVMNGAPLDMTSGVVATWVDGEIAWSGSADESGASTSVVIDVQELHVGDGTVISPGQMLLKDGKIAAIGSRVGRPAGATVVRAFAAMPGMIDALGHLGLEGSRKPISPSFDLTRIVEPGDFADRRVAQAGVTTVNLSSRAAPGSGSPTMAYKPAGDDVDAMVIAQANSFRMQWTASIRSQSGKSVRTALGKAKAYVEKWAKYEADMAAYVPPAPEEPKAEEEDDEKEEEGDEEKDEEKDDKKKKKKKKKKDKDEPARPVTGVWEGELGDAKIRFRLLDSDGALSGNLRSDALSSTLIEVSGNREEKSISLSGRGSRGAVSITLELAKDELKGSATVAGEELEVTVKQTATEYVVAGRSERRKPESPPKAPKGQPKSPGIKPELEPLRRAMQGKATVIVSVERADEILACVAAFEEFGIKPVLYGANDAHKVANEIQGRVAGVLLSHVVTAADPKIRTKVRNRYAELSDAGIPVAFRSAAEEGAVELPLMAAYAVAHGMSPEGALRALTSDAAKMLSIDHRVGRLARQLDADVVLLDGSPLDVSSSVLRVWVAGKEIR